MRRCRRATGCALLLVAGVALAAARTQGPASVSGSADALTVTAEHAHLDQVLLQIARHQGLVVRTQVALDEPVRVAIRAQPLATVLRRLLRDYSFTLQLDGRRPVTGHLYIHARGASGTAVLATPQQFGISDVDDRSAALARLAAGSADERLDGVAVLAAFGGDGSYAALAAALHDADPRVRAEAVSGLGDQFPAAGLQLVSTALRDADAGVRRAAIDVLSDAGTADAVELLAPVLRDPAPDARRRVVEALGEMDTAAADALLWQARGDPDADTSRLAADYLAERALEARVARR